MCFYKHIHPCCTLFFNEPNNKKKNIYDTRKEPQMQP